MATSTSKEDYLGRKLANATPGTTDPVKDTFGRNTTSTADYLGRALTSLNWPGAVPVSLGTEYWVVGGTLVVTTAGTAAAGAPALPGSVGGTVVSGTATLTRNE
jgi:hypothetical protein